MFNNEMLTEKQWRKIERDHAKIVDMYSLELQQLNDSIGSGFYALNKKALKTLRERRHRIYCKIDPEKFIENNIYSYMNL